MDLFIQAKDLLTVSRFDRKRCLQAIELLNQAKGQERRKIGQMFESQYVLCRSADDQAWLTKQLQKVPR
jgi:hypothetical protein